MRKFSRRAAAMSATAILLAAFGPVVRAEQSGSHRETAVVGEVPMTVYTYRPADCGEPALLFVFHGNGRSASSYLDHARPLADRGCFLVFAPLFDEARFPNWSYHRGGIVNDDGLVPPAEWTVRIVADLVEWARRREGRPDAPYYLFGHSAGAQFLSRVAAFALPADARRIVIANPSSYVMPSLDEPAPYGLGGVFGPGVRDARLRAYLELPVTIYLGAEDTGDEDLLDNDAARRQGQSRIERGENVFAAARAAAAATGAAFAWKLVVARGIGHSAASMLGSAEVMEAFGLVGR